MLLSRTSTRRRKSEQRQRLWPKCSERDLVTCRGHRLSDRSPRRAAPYLARACIITAAVAEQPKRRRTERESKRENEILFSRYEAQCVRPLTHLTTQRPRLNPFFCLCFALIFPNATSLLTSFARALHTAPLLRARFFFICSSLSLSLFLSPMQ